MERENTPEGMPAEGFPPVATADWEQKIKEDLQGADYEKELVWETHDGYRIRPYYRSGDLKGIGYLGSLPGQYPYLRGRTSADNSWLIRQDIGVRDIRSGNLEAVEIIEKGATSIGFDLSSLSAVKEKDIHSLLKNLPIDKVPVNFIHNGPYPEILQWLHSYALALKTDPSGIAGSISLNPLGRLAETGNDRKEAPGDFSELSRCLEFARNNLPGFRVVHNCGNLFHEAGASITQELAFTLSMGNEYLVELTGMGFPLADILPHMQFRFSIGSSYFMEIAKLRSARFLWSRILQAYPDFREDMPPMYLLSQTSRWNQTRYDPHVNMLRGTTAAMSAILGGTDSLTVLPFDLPAGGPAPSSLRIARNVQIILQEEAYLDKVVDPAAGSYYIENLTDTLINGAWDLFLRTEQKGGYRKSLQDGFIQRRVNETADLRLKNLATRKEVLLGTNQYPIPGEKAANRSAEKGRKVRISGKQGSFLPLTPFRAATEFEQLRLTTERHGGKTPVVFIIPLGPLAARRARAIFTINFFACAGFRVTDNIGKFKTVQEGMDTARREGADIVVLCSADDEYPFLVGDLLRMAGNDLIPVIAGHPAKHIDALKKAGVKHFIHHGSNVLEELKKYQKLLDIEMPRP